MAASTLQYWHLLSLDAPTVAVVWCAAFASAAHLRLPTLSYGLLFVATWGLYVADRLLDGMNAAPPASVKHAQRLRERHHFHARHRRAFLLAAIPLGLILAGLVATRMNASARHDDLLLAAAAACYLLCVHLPGRAALRSERLPGRWFAVPKELAVAIIFSIACVIPTGARQIAFDGWLIGSGVSFALLCWLNCVAIETWETSWEASATAQGAGRAAHPLTQAIGRRLRISCCIVAGAGLSLALVAALAGNTAFCIPALSVAASASLVYQLDRIRFHLAPVLLRAAADAVLLTPCVLLLLAHLRAHLR